MRGLVRFCVAGEPRSKQRARKGRNGFYTPKQTVEYEAMIRASVRDCEMLDCAIALHIRAYFTIPKSTAKYRQELMQSGDVRPIKKPDCDNVAKIVCDALNGVAWKDDAQIVTIAVEKFYSHEPRIEVTFWPHSGKDLRLVK